MQRLGGDLSCVFVWRIKALLAVSLMAENKYNEAVDLLEEVITMQ
jgi:hypothetical protein